MIVISLTSSNGSGLFCFLPIKKTEPAPISMSPNAAAIHTTPETLRRGDASLTLPSVIALATAAVNTCPDEVAVEEAATEIFAGLAAGACIDAFETRLAPAGSGGLFLRATGEETPREKFAGAAESGVPSCARLAQ